MPPVVAGASYTCTAAWMHHHILHASTQCMQVTIHVAINAVKLQLCVLKQNRLTVGCRICTQCTIWACARVSMSSVSGQGCCTAKFWPLKCLCFDGRRTCSQDFTRVAVYLVVQMDLSRCQSLTTAVKVSKSYLCGCDLWTVGHEVVLEHVPSLPLSPYFFHQWVIPAFPEIKIFFLMCLFVYFFDGLWPLEMVSLPPPASTLILTSLQLCVFSILL